MEDPQAEAGGTMSPADQQSTPGGPPPPPSPLSGCYLLIVIGEPHSPEHKEIILQKIAKGFLSWNVDTAHVDLEKELQALTSQAPEGEEARNGERLIQYATENLVTEVLIHPQLNTLLQCIRNLLSSFTRHRHLIHAGYTFAGNGSWILQDGTFSLADFIDAFQEMEVQRVLRAYENCITVDVHCSPEGDWTTERLSKELFSRMCKVRVNPDDCLTAGGTAIGNFINYMSAFLRPASIEQLLEPSDVVGNIRFSHPTLYVFPGGQGDAALFGINGFNMLVDGGFARKACFWDFARHLDRLDAVLMTRLNNGNINGIAAVLRRKKTSHVYPQIGHFFSNIQERRHCTSPDGDKDRDPLLVNLADEGHEMVLNLRHLQLRPHPCYRDGSHVEPVNLYHKVGHGKLDMYIISPARDSREVKEFLAKWNSNDPFLFSSHGKKDSSKEFHFPLQNLISICALLVWQPANPTDTITRILFPGSTPQHKIFEGLDKLKNLEFLKYPVCSARSLSPSASTVGISSRASSKQRSAPAVIDKLAPGEGMRAPAKMETIKQPPTPKAATIPVAGITEVKQTKPAAPLPSTPASMTRTQQLSAKPKSEKVSPKQEPTKPKTEITKPVEGEKPSAKVEKTTKTTTEITKTKVEHKAKTEMKTSISKTRTESKPPRSVERKSQKSSVEKKTDVKSSPTTPKKSLESKVNGVVSKAETMKAGRPLSKTRPSPTTTPAKSTKEANNRKVVESKYHVSRVSSVTKTSTSKVTKKETDKESTTKTERKPISRRPKTGSPSKAAAARPPGSPAKSSSAKSTPTPSVKSDKDGVIRRPKGEGEKIPTDSSAVSTPSTVDQETATLKAKGIGIDEKVPSLVNGDLTKEEKLVVEEIEDAIAVEEAKAAIEPAQLTSEAIEATTEEIKELKEEVESTAEETEIEEVEGAEVVGDDGKEELTTEEEEIQHEKLMEREELERTEEERTEEIDEIEEAEGGKPIDIKESLQAELQLEEAKQTVRDVEEEEEEEDEEYLIVEKEEIEESAQEPESLESHLPQEVETEEEEAELQKHLRDEVESEKQLKDKVVEEREIKVNGIEAHEEEEEEEELVHEGTEYVAQKESTEKLKQFVPEPKQEQPTAEDGGPIKKVTSPSEKEYEGLTLETKEQLEEEVQEIITSATEIVTKSKIETEEKPEEKDKLKDQISEEKKDSDEAEDKEISSTSPEEKLDISSEKNREATEDTRDTDQKLEEERDEGIEVKETGSRGVIDQKYPAEESQPDEKFSTTVESGATTAPTLPEDERIPLDEIKEIVEEKHVKEETKEKEKTVEVPARLEQPTTLPQVVMPAGIGIFDPRGPHVILHQRDIVKTPDEVADLPVHEEVDTGMYEIDEFGREFQKTKDDAIPLKKSQELEELRQQDVKTETQLTLDEAAKLVDERKFVPALGTDIKIKEEITVTKKETDEKPQVMAREDVVDEKPQALAGGATVSDELKTGETDKKEPKIADKLSDKLVDYIDQKAKDSIEKEIETDKQDQIKPLIDEQKDFVEAKTDKKESLDVQDDERKLEVEDTTKSEITDVETKDKDTEKELFKEETTKFDVKKEAKEITAHFLDAEITASKEQTETIVKDQIVDDKQEAVEEKLILEKDKEVKQEEKPTEEKKEVKTPVSKFDDKLLPTFFSGVVEVMTEPVLDIKVDKERDIKDSLEHEDKTETEISKEVQLSDHPLKDTQQEEKEISEIPSGLSATYLEIIEKLQKDTAAEEIKPELQKDDEEIFKPESIKEDEPPVEGITMPADKAIKLPIAVEEDKQKVPAETEVKEVLGVAEKLSLEDKEISGSYEDADKLKLEKEDKSKETKEIMDVKKQDEEEFTSKKIEDVMKIKEKELIKTEITVGKAIPDISDVVKEAPCVAEAISEVKEISQLPSSPKEGKHEVTTDEIVYKSEIEFDKYKEDMPFDVDKMLEKEEQMETITKVDQKVLDTDTKGVIPGTVKDIIDEKVEEEKLRPEEISISKEQVLIETDSDKIIVAEELDIESIKAEETKFAIDEKKKQIESSEKEQIKTEKDMKDSNGEISTSEQEEIHVEEMTHEEEEEPIQIKDVIQKPSEPCDIKDEMKPKDEGSIKIQDEESDKTEGKPTKPEDEDGIKTGKEEDFKIKEIPIRDGKPIEILEKQPPEIKEEGYISMEDSITIKEEHTIAKEEQIELTDEHSDEIKEEILAESKECKPVKIQEDESDKLIDDESTELVERKLIETKEGEPVETYKDEPIKTTDRDSAEIKEKKAEEDEFLETKDIEHTSITDYDYTEIREEKPTERKEEPAKPKESAPIDIEADLDQTKEEHFLQSTSEVTEHIKFEKPAEDEKSVITKDVKSETLDDKSIDMKYYEPEESQKEKAIKTTQEELFKAKVEFEDELQQSKTEKLDVSVAEKETKELKGKDSEESEEEVETDDVTKDKPSETKDKFKEVEDFHKITADKDKSISIIEEKASITKDEPIEIQGEKDVKGEELLEIKTQELLKEIAATEEIDEKETIEELLEKVPIKGEKEQLAKIVHSGIEPSQDTAIVDEKDVSLKIKAEPIETKQEDMLKEKGPVQSEKEAIDIKEKELMKDKTGITKSECEENVTEKIETEMKESSKFDEMREEKSVPPMKDEKVSEKEVVGTESPEAKEVKDSQETQYEESASEMILKEESVDEDKTFTETKTHIEESTLETKVFEGKDLEDKETPLHKILEKEVTTGDVSVEHISEKEERNDAKELTFKSEKDYIDVDKVKEYEVSKKEEITSLEQIKKEEVKIGSQKEEITSVIAKTESETEKVLEPSKSTEKLEDEKLLESDMIKTTDKEVKEVEFKDAEEQGIIKADSVKAEQVVREETDQLKITDELKSAEGDVGQILEDEKHTEVKDIKEHDISPKKEELKSIPVTEERESAISQAEGELLAMEKSKQLDEEDREIIIEDKSKDSFTEKVDMFVDQESVAKEMVVSAAKEEEVVSKTEGKYTVDEEPLAKGMVGSIVEEVISKAEAKHTVDEEPLAKQSVVSIVKSEPEGKEPVDEEPFTKEMVVSAVKEEEFVSKAEGIDAFDKELLAKEMMVSVVKDEKLVSKTEGKEPVDEEPFVKEMAASILKGEMIESKTEGKESIDVVDVTTQETKESSIITKQASPVEHVVCEKEDEDHKSDYEDDTGDGEPPPSPGEDYIDSGLEEEPVYTKLEAPEHPEYVMVTPDSTPVSPKPLPGFKSSGEQEDVDVMMKISVTDTKTIPSLDSREVKTDIKEEIITSTSKLPDAIGTKEDVEITLEEKEKLSHLSHLEETTHKEVFETKEVTKETVSGAFAETKVETDVETKHVQETEIKSSLSPCTGSQEDEALPSPSSELKRGSGDISPEGTDADVQRSIEKVSTTLTKQLTSEVEDFLVTEKTMEEVSRTAVYAPDNIEIQMSISESESEKDYSFVPEKETAVEKAVDEVVAHLQKEKCSVTEETAISEQKVIQEKESIVSSSDIQTATTSIPKATTTVTHISSQIKETSSLVDGTTEEKADVESSEKDIILAEKTTKEELPVITSSVSSVMSDIAEKTSSSVMSKVSEISEKESVDEKISFVKSSTSVLSSTIATSSLSPPLSSDEEDSIEKSKNEISSRVISEVSSATPRVTEEKTEKSKVSVGDSTTSTTVRRMVVTASSEDGGVETELSPSGSISISSTVPDTATLQGTTVVSTTGHEVTAKTEDKFQSKEISMPTTETVSGKTVTILRKISDTNGDAHDSDQEVLSSGDERIGGRTVTRKTTTTTTTRRIIRSVSDKESESDDDHKDGVTEETITGEDGRTITRRITRRYVTRVVKKDGESDDDRSSLGSVVMDDIPGSPRSTTTTTKTYRTTVKKGYAPEGDADDYSDGSEEGVVKTSTTTTTTTVVKKHPLDSDGEVTTSTTTQEVVAGDATSKTITITTKDEHGDVSVKTITEPCEDESSISNLKDGFSTEKLTKQIVDKSSPQQSLEEHKIDKSSSEKVVTNGECQEKCSVVCSTVVTKDTAETVMGALSTLGGPVAAVKKEAGDVTRSITPGSDAMSDRDMDLGGPSTPHSDISSGQVSRAATNIWGGTESRPDSRHCDSDEEDAPASPMSVTSQVAHSPLSTSHFEFEAGDSQRLSSSTHPTYETSDTAKKTEHTISSSMTSSFYGSLPTEPEEEEYKNGRETTGKSERIVMSSSYISESHPFPIESERQFVDESVDFERALYEHRAARGEDLASASSPLTTYHYEMKTTGSPSHTVKYEHHYSTSPGVNGQRMSGEHGLREFTEDYGNGNVAGAKQFEDVMNRNRDIKHVLEEKLNGKSEDTFAKFDMPVSSSYKQETYTTSSVLPGIQTTKQNGAEERKSTVVTTTVYSSSSGLEHDPMFHHQFPTASSTGQAYPEPPQEFGQSSASKPDPKKDPIEGWGKPLGLPAPAPPPISDTQADATINTNKTTPKKEKKAMQIKKSMIMNENNKTSGGKDMKTKSPESPVKQKGGSNKDALRNAKSIGSPIYVDLTYVPHHGNSYYTAVEFFKKVRARYYVFSGTEPSREVYNALLEAKQTWDDKELEVTIIPTYDTDTLGYWVAENEDLLAKCKIDLSPSASRCTINLQDHETSCSAYRLEF